MASTSSANVRSSPRKPPAESRGRWAANRPAKLLLALPHLDLLVTGPASRDVDSQADLDDLDDLAGPI